MRIPAFVLVFLLFLSCHSSTSKENQIVKVYGRIEPITNLPFEEISLIHRELGYRDQQIYYDSIEHDGSFEFQFKVQHPSDIIITGKGLFTKLIVHPSDSIFLTISINNGITDIVFSGDSEEINRNLYDFRKGYSEKVDFRNVFTKYAELNPIQFKPYMDSIYQELDYYRQNYLQNNNCCEELKAWIEAETIENYYGTLLIYPNQHCIMNDMGWQDLEFPKDYYDDIDALSDFQPDLLINADFSFYFPNYLRSFLGMWSLKNNGWDTELDYDSIITESILSFKESNNLLMQLLLNEYVHLQFSSLDTLYYSNNRELIELEITHPALYSSIKRKYIDIKMELDQPAIASKLIFEQLDGTSLRNVFNQIISNNRGKIVFVDCWGTFCAPCRRNLRQSSYLHNEFSSSEVEFIYMCKDSKKDDWERIRDEIDISGEHYYLDPSQSKSFNQVFSNGTPYFILFDREGNIIEKGSHLTKDRAIVSIRNALKENS